MKHRTQRGVVVCALADLELEADRRTAVIAYPIGQSYANFEIWTCVRMSE